MVLQPSSRYRADEKPSGSQVQMVKRSVMLFKERLANYTCIKLTLKKKKKNLPVLWLCETHAPDQEDAHCKQLVGKPQVHHPSSSPALPVEHSSHLGLVPGFSGDRGGLCFSRLKVVESNLKIQFTGSNPPEPKNRS